MKIHTQYCYDILYLLHQRHQSAKTTASIPIGTRDRETATKQKGGVKQQEVASNLDYLIQAKWSTQVTEQQHLLKSRMEAGKERAKHEISRTAVLETSAAFHHTASIRQIDTTSTHRSAATTTPDTSTATRAWKALSRLADAAGTLDLVAKASTLVSSLLAL